MNKDVHFDADIFYTALIIRTIRQGCSLNIDSDFFLDKIMEDIMFVDRTLKNIMEQLDGDIHSIDTGQYVRNLYLVKRDLVFLLDDIRGMVFPFAQYLKQYESRFAQIIVSQKTDMMKLDDILTTDEQKNNDKDILSSEEYQILFDVENT